MKMKNYLSFGGGVNSIALYLYLVDQKIDFEAVFVNHGTDWPETYEYVNMFKKKYPLTILKPKVKRGNVFYSSLYDMCFERKIKPHYGKGRWCTINFKRDTLKRYQKPPCFVLLGIDFGEQHRAHIVTDGGFEYRYPLIENEINRDGCIEIIKQHGLPVPPKSGCYICPYQKLEEWVRMRKEKPELFCKAEQIERGCNDRRLQEKKRPLCLSIYKVPLRALIKENQKQLWAENEYPPCECGL